jgi:hypothetical protein
MLRPRRERCRTIFRRCRSGKWPECHKDRLPRIMPGRPIRSSGTALDSPVATWSPLLAAGDPSTDLFCQTRRAPATRKTTTGRESVKLGGELVPENTPLGLFHCGILIPIWEVSERVYRDLGYRLPPDLLESRSYPSAKSILPGRRELCVS